MGILKGHDLIEARPSPPQISGFGRTFVRLWNIIHKLPFKIPCQDFI